MEPEPYKVSIYCPHCRYSGTHRFAKLDLAQWFVQWARDQQHNHAGKRGSVSLTIATERKR